MDTGSTISIIRSCQTANASPLNIIGQIKLEVRVEHIKTTVLVDVATNLVTPIILGNNWIDANHIDLYGQPTSIPYDEPPHIICLAFLINQMTIPPHYQILVDVNT